MHAIRFFCGAPQHGPEGFHLRGPIVVAGWIAAPVVGFVGSVRANTPQAKENLPKYAQAARLQCSQQAVLQTKISPMKNLLLCLLLTASAFAASASPVSVSGVELKETGRGEDWVRFTWRATISNPSKEAKQVRTRIALTDARGSVVEERVGDRVTVQPGKSEVVSGAGSTTAAAWALIKTCKLTCRESGQ
jgi:hypothetical protein